ncbi:retropepsin-like aspartic protease family protein [Sphingomonas sp.]|uniref:retropepsin-like aspartic protease family protein n=1 Tax=Sphingomonas sp. TaxID=28214 RepID=UPI002DD69B3E|nr:TIGR02281 family clan AA aspartic protease [Sphingomonas sp.]
MNSDDSVSLLWGLGALVLVVSAITARRLSFGAIARSVLAWLVIFGAAWAVFANRDRIEPVIAAVGERLGIGAQSVEGDTVRIQMSQDGHFWARVSLDGFERRMLVDSGATITALSEETARRAGIDVSASGFPVVINTANGSVQARRANIERVTLGSLDTRDLGVVVSPAFGETDVLGMNFLSRLGSWRVEGRTLILEPKRAGTGA